MLKSLCGRGGYFLKNRSGFALYTCVVGLIVGVFSVASDHLPYTRVHITLFQFIRSYVAVMVNSLPFWFIFAMVPGFSFAKDLKSAMFAGGIHTIIAITYYFVIGYFFDDNPVKPTINDQVRVFVSWYGASAIGGVAGGAAGFMFKRNPFVLIIVMLGLLLQLILSGPESWRNELGIAQNLTFCLMVVGFAAYLMFIWKRKKSNYSSA
ncbi:hypothetical protein D9X91_19690 [Falsibacillus albus]|uniref:Uncharacterized protein n=2 Tax=Falsibacillus albus TaxID=2478915 RepID=A0A3L7JQJ5_9BACI|nr:hypothetical protein D9X91_19690 [Falsibacillus albus]